MESAKNTTGYNKREILDLDYYVEKFFRTQRFDKTKDQESKHIRKLSYDDIDVDLSYTKVTKEDTTTEVIQEKNEIEEATKEKPVLLYRTEYKNHTNDVQEYTVNAERTTTTECSAVVKKGYRLEGSVNLNLTLGNILEVGAGLTSEISVDKEFGITDHNEMKWGINTTIKVPKDKKAIAEMTVLEKQHKAEFDITSVLSGRVVAKFLDLTDNNSLIATFREDLSKIVMWAKDKYDSDTSHRLLTSVTVDKMNKSVTIKCNIECEIQYSVRQNVTITEHDIQEE